VNDCSPPDAILLDALGTLVELKPPAPRLRQELARRFGIVVTEALAERAIAAEIVYYRANLDAGRDAESLSALRAHCAEIVRAELGSSLVGVTTAELTDALLASIRFSVFADVRPALSAASARGARLVVVSNWDASLHDVLTRLELTPLLDGVVTSAQSGARKPSAAIFEHGLSLAGTVAERAIHVGDSIGEDVAGARAAGIEPVLLLRDGGPAPPGVRAIGSLAELGSYS
jgi:putative hydrolase of the HAD superfamily